MNHSLKKFAGEDWSSGKVREGLNNGQLTVGWNRDDGDKGEVILVIKDCFNPKMEGCVVLNRENAADLINHLTELLKESNDEA